MGLDAIPDRTDDETIDASFMNVIKSVLKGNIVTRDATGVTAGKAGSFGSDLYRFLSTYVKSINLGDSSSTFTIEEATNDIVFKFDNVEKKRIKSAGLDQQVSASCGSFTGTGDITNLSVTITTYGRPVFVGLISETGHILFQDSLNIIRDATLIAKYLGQNAAFPCSGIKTIDIVAAGTYTYKASFDAADNSTIIDAKLIAYEL